MTDDALAAVLARLSATRHRVKVIDTPDGRVVAKRQRPGRTVWRARALNALARAFGLSLLQAVPTAGGADAQATEVARLRALGDAGVRVPPLLHVDPDFIVIGHLDGPSLVDSIEAGGAAGLAAWRRGLDALVAVHAAGGYLSQAFARNFIDTVDGLAMIDFEDDPLRVMTLADAQARDWLAYLHSTARMLDAPRGVARGAVARALAAEPPAVRRLVQAASHRLAGLRHLPTSRRVFGREVVGVQAMAALFPVPAMPGADART